MQTIAFLRHVFKINELDYYTMVLKIRKGFKENLTFNCIANPGVRAKIEVVNEGIIQPLNIFLALMTEKLTKTDPSLS